MSLITRCPACSTMFKVVPDQLRVSDGWVRCGQCDEVFDANAHLQSLEDAQTPAPVKPPEVQETREFPETSDAKDPLDAVPADDLGSSEPGPISQAHADLQSDLQSDLAPTPTPHFLKPEPAASAQQSRGARFVVALLCVVSTSVLLVQWMVHERDRIAATEPAALVVLEPLCAVLDCRIAPLRQIESLVIDSSSFGKTQADVYRLGFSVKTTALVEVAAPSLELTLTDAQDKAVVRRVFSPQDLGAQRPTLASGGEWTGSVPVTVKPPAGAERISGYRLLAFYP
ncbi:MAG: hypothetical protein RL302_438 [Pseudomonadota bacterium]